jgi:hypothetical protein
MISLPHPGFLTECTRTLTPVLVETVLARERAGSDEEREEIDPAVLETTSSREPG